MPTFRVITALFLLTVAVGATLPEPPVVVAESTSCQQSCRAQASQCRISTKGSSSCDAALHGCLQSCIPKR